ncbi:MAG: flippase-like domain-containing protein [Polyangiaceae bacterium]|nr:flippase-like domain-containing protein [Polyangiaceae bacterium]
MPDPAPVSPPDDEPPRERGWHRFILPGVVSFAIAGGSAWALHEGALPVVPEAGCFAEVAWWTLPIYLLLYLTTLLLRAVRWHWLLLPIQPVGIPRILRISYIFYGATIVLPFRLGELVRPSLLHRKARVSWWAASGISGAERVIDGLVLSLLLFVALQVADPLPVLPDRIGDLNVPVSVVPGAAYSALALFAALFLAMGLFYWRREWVTLMLHRCLGVISERLADHAAGVLERLASGLGFLPKTRYSLPFLGTTLAYWGINVASVWVLVWGTGVDTLTLAQGAAVLGVLALGFLVPNVPGFFGTFQLSLYAGLAMYVPPEVVKGPGAAAVFLMYVLQMVIALVCAGIALALESRTPAATLGTGD